MLETHFLTHHKEETRTQKLISVTIHNYYWLELLPEEEEVEQVTTIDVWQHKEGRGVLATPDLCVVLQSHHTR